MKNALHNETLKWVGDGSDGSTLTQTGKDVVIASKSSGTPFNARLNSQKCASDYYLEVNITQLKGNFSLGAVRQDEMKPGWKTKGMFYNGNLTNASGALSVDWGPRFGAGDTLGIRVSRGDALEVAFYKNGDCLGTGFQLAGNTATYYPCLHVSGSCSLSVEIPKQLPSADLDAATPTGFCGDWKIDKAWEGETPVTVPDGRPIKHTLSKEKGNIQLRFKVGNSIGGQATIIEETDTSMTVETGPFMMSRMMPPPAYRPLENLIGSKKITQIDLEEDTTLILSGPEMKLECTRLARNPEPLSSY